MNAVNVIVTCTKQKTTEPSPRLMLRNVQAKTPMQRVEKWVQALQSSPDQQMSAKSLYAGDHWAVVREISELTTKSREIRVWVASAGYGLVSIDELLFPYASTFSSPHSDSVVELDSDIPRSVQKRDWWNALVAFDWKREAPHSIAALAKEDPRTPVVLAASRNYLQALQDDLGEALDLLDTNNSLSIISAGTESMGDLTKCLLPCNAKLQHYVGGVRRSLNIRLVRHALQKFPSGKMTYSRLGRHFESLVENAPPLVKYDREAMTDGAVQRFVRAQMNKRPDVTHTKLLRELRSGGRACEQKRFRRLFEEVKEAFNG